MEKVSNTLNSVNSSVITKILMNTTSADEFGSASHHRHSGAPQANPEATLKRDIRSSRASRVDPGFRCAAPG
jgi:hypothetical protein